MPSTLTSQEENMSSLRVPPELFRSTLDPSQLSLPLSPAGLQATRLAATCQGSFVFATGTTAYELQLSSSKKRTRAEQRTSVSEERSGHDDGNVDGTNEGIGAIADDYLVPRPTASTSVARIPLHSSHIAEIQAISTDGMRIASVSAYGHGIVTLTDTRESHGQQTGDSSTCASQASEKCFVLPPVSLSNGDAGWCGISLRPNDHGTSAITRQLYRDVSVFDRDVATRTFHTLLPPGAASFAGTVSSPMIAVTEGGDVALYDIRAGEQGGCALRKEVAPVSLLALDVSEDGSLLTVGGRDRVLHTFDVRATGVIDRWAACLKYECAGVLLSRSQPGLAYVCSVDNEVAAGACNEETAMAIRSLGMTRSTMMSGANTKSVRRAFGFRGDVRLTGIALRHSYGEELGALSESGAFYLLRRAGDRQ